MKSIATGPLSPWRLSTLSIGCTPKGSLKEVLLRRVLRRHLVRVLVGTGVLRRVLRGGGFIEGA